MTKRRSRTRKSTHEVSLDRDCDARMKQVPPFLRPDNWPSGMFRSRRLTMIKQSAQVRLLGAMCCESNKKGEICRLPRKHAEVSKRLTIVPRRCSPIGYPLKWYLVRKLCKSLCSSTGSSYSRQRSDTVQAYTFVVTPIPRAFLAYDFYSVGSCAQDPTHTAVMIPSPWKIVMHAYRSSSTVSFPSADATSTGLTFTVEQ